ncbi:GNAT family N-acetyltransferase [Streptomyces milbemycinicus]|uniref:GNAT family N-acetyltransferase n=1 Tax=Streptomyces milbemycinicus TaxID=476552 RepID=UPI000A36F3B0|nr:GNAT family N-acetyltransferase [Streptomyces milbemycinicus]
MKADVLTLSTYKSVHLPQIRPILLDVYAEVWAKEAATDPFLSVERFNERLSGHTSGGDWTCVIGEVGGKTVGYAYGRLDSVSEWHEVLNPVDPGVHDYGSDGTFGLCEIMVRAPWRGKSIARGIHDELMRQRTEDRASLLVDHERPKVRALYEKWGYHRVGEMQPYPDSPRYDVMVFPLG